MVAVVGLGDVGLPLAAEFGKHRPTIGYDVSGKRIAHLMHRFHTTGEFAAVQFEEAQYLWITHDPSHLERADFVIVAVPTSNGSARERNLGSLESATRTVARHLRHGATVIYESTVYPGATEEICVPILEMCSGMRWREGFHVGYFLERIAAGDGESDLSTVTRMVAGDDAETLEKIADLYASLAQARVQRVSSIRAVEVARAFEKRRQDFNRTRAYGQWIDVDECSFVPKTQVGLNPPEPVFSPCCPDAMGAHIARKAVHRMIHARGSIQRATVNVLGLASNENCPDVRDSMAVDIVRELRDLGVQTFVYDPVADPIAALRRYDLQLRAWKDLPRAQALILAVPHRYFIDLPAATYLQKIARRGCLIDVKAVLDPHLFRREGLHVWQL
jgi:UDP-N-acetyl-D-galactosamine dehydrogenase